MLTDSVDFIIFVVGYSSYRLYLFEKKKNWKFHFNLPIFSI